MLQRAALAGPPLLVETVGINIPADSSRSGRRIRQEAVRAAARTRSGSAGLRRHPAAAGQNAPRPRCRSRTARGSSASARQIAARRVGSWTECAVAGAEARLDSARLGLNDAKRSAAVGSAARGVCGTPPAAAAGGHASTDAAIGQWTQAQPEPAWTRSPVEPARCCCTTSSFNSAVRAAFRCSRLVNFCCSLEQTAPPRGRQAATAGKHRGVSGMGGSVCLGSDLLLLEEPSSRFL